MDAVNSTELANAIVCALTCHLVCQNETVATQGLRAISQLCERILQTIEVLPAEDQQQVLDFVEFLWAKRRAEIAAIESPSRSFLEITQGSIGAGEGPGDLSTNPDYMQGYGQ